MTNKKKKYKRNITEEDVKNGLDERGKFKKGNKLSGSRGNPIYKKMYALRMSYLNCVGPDDMSIAYKSMFKNIENGCAISLKLFYEYCLGKPMDQEQLAIKMGENYFKIFQFFTTHMKEMGYDSSKLKEFADKFDARTILFADSDIDKC